MLESFKSLSEILCDVDQLPVSLAEDYYKIIAEKAELEELLIAYQSIVAQNPDDIVQAIKEQLLENPNLKIAIKQIIQLWYLGRTESLQVLKGDKHYYHYEALIWKVLHAHPPGLTGGYYGHWAYKPEL